MGKLLLSEYEEESICELVYATYQSCFANAA